MLKLAPAAARIVAAGRRLVMRAGRNAAVGQQPVAGRGERGMASVGGHALAAPGDTNDGVAVAHPLGLAGRTVAGSR